MATVLQAVALVFDHVLAELQEPQQQPPPQPPARTESAPITVSADDPAAASAPPLSPSAAEVADTPRSEGPLSPGRRMSRAGSLSPRSSGPVNAALKLLDDLCMMATGVLQRNVYRHWVKLQSGVFWRLMTQV